MIDFIQYFKNKVQILNPILTSYGYQFIVANNPYQNKELENSYDFEYDNFNLQINLCIGITRYKSGSYVISFSLHNKKTNEIKFTWRSFYLNDYIKDNNLQDQFKYKIQGDENVEAFIDQYFNNLEFALNDYLKPYVTGEKYIDHYVRMMDDYYAKTSALQMQEEIIKEHLAKQGKMVVFRQMVIGIKQDVRNYMDKVKNFFLPPNLR